MLVTRLAARLSKPIPNPRTLCNFRGCPPRPSISLAGLGGRVQPLRVQMRPFSIDSEPAAPPLHTAAEKVDPILLARHTNEKNPLLWEGPPCFDLIESAHVVPAVTSVLADLNKRFSDLEATASPSWPRLVEPLEAMLDRLDTLYNTITHLKGVKDSPAIRAAVEAVQPEVVRFGLRVGQSRVLYDNFCRMYQQRNMMDLTPQQVRIIELQIRDAKLAGVGLDQEQRAQFNKIQEELGQLGLKFANNVLDATKSLALVITDPADVQGLPDSLLEMAAQNARQLLSKPLLKLAKATAKPSDKLPAGVERLSGGAVVLRREALSSSGAEGEVKGVSATAKKGPWVITLDQATYVPFQQYCARRELREFMYREYNARASAAPSDNSQLIPKILQLRTAQAQLLGFNSFAETSIASKMVPSVDKVLSFLEEIRQHALPAAQRELADLTAFAQSNGHDGPLRQWDVGYWTERYRAHLFKFSEEDLRPFFPFPQVLQGFFDLCRLLFGVKLSPLKTYTSPSDRLAFQNDSVAVWHPDVKAFQVAVKAGSGYSTEGAVYIDPYSRPAEKQSGAWMHECISRRAIPVSGTADHYGNAAVQIRNPYAYLICNQAPPIGKGKKAKPSLMNMDEVRTLFHEFGHTLQHVLTTVDSSLVSGIRGIEWDAVELPSQFMENWCYDRNTLVRISKHVETGEPLSEELISKIQATRNFMQGLATLNQLRYGLIDMELHRLRAANDFSFEKAAEVVAKVTEKTSVLPTLPTDRFICSFKHIFAGGYSAGYYSYHYAQVMAADAFGAFEEAGVNDPNALRATGLKFLDSVLALGGSRPAGEVFRTFRGRDPSVTALLKQYGFIKGAKSEPAASDKP